VVACESKKVSKEIYTKLAFYQKNKGGKMNGFEELINTFNVEHLLIERNKDGTYKLSATIDGYDYRYDKGFVSYDIVSDGLTIDDYCINTTRNDISSSVKHSLSIGKTILNGNEGVFLDMRLRE